MDTSRDLKQFNRHEHRTGVTFMLPLSEWWVDIPYFPNSLPENEIRVQEFNDERKTSRREYVDLLSHDAIEMIIEWYLKEMTKTGWSLIPEGSQYGKPNATSAQLQFSKPDERVLAEVSIQELGKEFDSFDNLDTPPDRPVDQLAYSLKQLMDIRNEPIIKKYGKGIKRITEGHSKLR